MPQQKTLKNNLDDVMTAIQITDFSGGLNSESDPSDLPMNTSPDCQNVKFNKAGRVIGREGFMDKITGLAGAPDGLAFFYDVGGGRKIVLWAAGNIYNVSDLVSASLIASSVYTAGERVAWTVLNSVLYYSDGTIPLRQWDGTTEQAVANSGGAGTIAPPAARVLTTYAGSIVAGNTNVGGFQEPHAVRWCVVNDATTWFGTDIQEVGAGQGGEVNTLISVGVSSVGVSPYRAIFVGKSRAGVFVLKGALGTLEEVLVNAPTGVLDGLTAKFLPGPDGSGYILFLGTDYKVWATNGVTTQEVSGAIRSELHEFVTETVSSTSKPVFCAVENYEDFQYILDVGRNRQYVLDYDRRIWTRYSGYPSGYMLSARDTNGNQLMLVADRTTNRLCKLNEGLTDNGAAINPYYKTGWLHAGDPDLFKVWKWLYLAFRTDTGQVDVTAQVNQAEGVSCSFSMLSGGTNVGAIWDVSLWDVGLWGQTVLHAYKKKARFFHNTTGLDGSVESLRGFDIQLTLAGSPAGSAFEILGLTILFLPRGRKRVVP